jgi:hypothetical protein
MTLESHSLEPSGIDRRTALKRGAIVGGVVLWSTPVVNAIGVGVADAASEPAPPPPPPSAPPPPPAPTGLPSHGFFLLLCEGKYLGYQIIGAESSPTLKKGQVVSPVQVGSPGDGNDVPYWQANGYGHVDLIVNDGQDPAWTTIRNQIVAGTTRLSNVQVLVLDSYPASCQLLNAHIWDGSFQTDPDGDKARPAYFIDGNYYFYK